MARTPYLPRRETVCRTAVHGMCSLCQSLARHPSGLPALVKRSFSNGSQAVHHSTTVKLKDGSGAPCRVLVPGLMRYSVGVNDRAAIAAYIALAVLSVALIGWAVFAM